MIENGYIQGSFAQSLPFFFLGQECDSLYWDDRRRNLRRVGTFNIK